MSDTQIELDPYADLPQPVVTEIERLNKSASRLTIGMIVSLFFPAGFLFVVGFGIFRLVQAKNLVQKFPEIKDPLSQFPDKSKREVKAISLLHENLKKVIEFKEAQKGFVIIIAFPVVVISVLTALLLINQ